MRRIQYALATLILMSCQQAVPSSEDEVVVTLEGLSLEIPGHDFPAKSAFQLRAWGIYSDGTKVDVTAQTQWSSSNAAVGRVGPTGVVQLDEAGTARLEGRLQEHLVEATIRVTGAALLSVAIESPSSELLPKGDTRQLRARALYSDGTSLDVTTRATWEADGLVVSATQKPGLMVALTQGDGSVDVTYLNQHASLTFQVGSPRFLGLSLAAPQEAIHPGDTHQLRLYSTFSDGSRRDVSAQATWTSSAPTVVELSANGASGGVAFARSAGDVRISAHWNDLTTFVQMLVLARHVVALGFDATRLPLAQGQSSKVELFAGLDDGTRVEVSNSAVWTSSEPTVAEVSNVDPFRGAVTSHTQGSALIRASYAGFEANYLVEVTEPILTSMSASLSGGRLLLGQNVEVIVTGIFSDGAQLNLSPVTAVRHGNGVLSSATNDNLNLKGAIIGPALVDIELASHAVQLSFDVSGAQLTSLEILDPNQNALVSGPTILSPRFQALATYSDGVKLDVTEMCNWWIDDVEMANMSDIPGYRGAYGLTKGGQTNVRAAMENQVAVLPWQFPANP